MIDLKKMSREKRDDCLSRISRGGYEKGVVFLYHEGDYSNMVGRSELGRYMRDMFDAGSVDLFQKVTRSEPREYAYYAVSK